MHKTIWAAFLVTVVGASLLFWTLKASLRYKPALPRGVPQNITREELEEMRRQAQEERHPTARLASRAVVAEAEVDFGTLDPGAADEHLFIIRNAGLEPLKLGDPQPTCSCAAAELSRRVVPPGESAEFKMSWHVGDKTGPFSVGVDLPTSDPENNPLSFRVSGYVRQQLGASPEYFALGDLSPDQTPTTHEAVIFSQVWDSFAVENLHCTLAGAAPSISPASAEELQAQRAKSGYRLALALPENLPTGPFNGNIEFSARPANSDEAIVYTIGIAGKVRGRYSIHGSAINEEAIVDIGTLAHGEGKTTRLLLKVRDAQKTLPNARFEIEPNPVQARLIEQGVASGLYTIEIEVPREAPAGVHLRPDQWGTLTLLTDHPRIPSIKLRLRYAVTEQADAAP